MPINLEPSEFVTKAEMEPHPRFHRGDTFYSGFPARHAWCQAWQAGTPARGAESRFQKAHSSPGKPCVFWAPG
jgi:hypothetical protein